MLIFWSLVRNSVVLAVYLLFSVACFLTVHEHLFLEEKMKKLCKKVLTSAGKHDIITKLSGADRTLKTKIKKLQKST